MNNSDLRKRLQDWASVYGGEQYRRLGYSATDRLAAAQDVHTIAAVAVDMLNQAEQIERIVQAMEQSGRWKEARVLRAEFFMSGLSEAERLERLSRIGVGISRANYYVFLRTALAFMAGAMTQSTDEQADQERAA